ncbi:MAG: PHP domain-containing protein [Clostridia bacterium]|nr:PHP domain-containing protein [Clostridia bacterium]
MAFLYETHLHTAESSGCGKAPAETYIEYYKAHGYTGIIISDHFYGSPKYVPDRESPWREQVDIFCKGYENARRAGEAAGLDVFFALEHNFGGDEILVYGPDKEWLYAHPDCGKWTRKQWFDEIDAIGGCVVQPHPFRWRHYVAKMTFNRCVHAIEGYNGGDTPEEDSCALAYAKRYGFKITSGSDRHSTIREEDEYFYGVYTEQRLTSVMDYVKLLRSDEPLKLKTGGKQGFVMPGPLPTEPAMCYPDGTIGPWDTNLDELIKGWE